MRRLFSRFPALVAVSLLASLPALAQKPPSRGNSFNPDISLNFLGGYRRSTRGNFPGAAQPNGFDFQEAELQLAADVDPYLRAVGIIAVAPDGAGGFEADPEEVYLETLSLPVVTLKAGRFRASVGRHNPLHAHAFPFIDAPLIHERLLGEEGLRDNGASAAVLLPAPWFLELTAQALASGTPTVFGSAEPNSTVGVARLRSLWDLSDSATLDLGVSAAGGGNSAAADTALYGVDLTGKWRPTEGGKYQALIATAEYLAASDHFDAAAPGASRGPLGGLAAWLQYQFAQRWWAQARVEWLGIPRPEGADRVRRQSALLAFLPSEFSGFRLQYDHLADSGPTPEHKVALQWNISIGAHPAHAY
jgi:hypothetical protein